jgi:hypothetical protein
MGRYFIAFALLALSGCGSEIAKSSFVGPNGQKLYQVKCKGNQSICYQEATKNCGESYQVLDSESRAGNLDDDTHPAQIPSMWYSMTYSCGKSDGKLPTFPLKGVTATPGSGPSFTNCNRIGTSLNCVQY